MLTTGVEGMGWNVKDIPKLDTYPYPRKRGRTTMDDLVNQIGDLPHWAQPNPSHVLWEASLTTLVNFYTPSLHLSQVTTCPHVSYLSLRQGRNCVLSCSPGLGTAPSLSPYANTS